MKLNFITDNVADGTAGWVVDKLEYTTTANGRYVMHLRNAGMITDDDAKALAAGPSFHRREDGRSLGSGAEGDGVYLDPNGNGCWYGPAGEAHCDGSAPPRMSLPKLDYQITTYVRPPDTTADRLRRALLALLGLIEDIQEAPPQGTMVGQNALQADPETGCATLTIQGGCEIAQNACARAIGFLDTSWTSITDLACDITVDLTRQDRTCLVCGCPYLVLQGGNQFCKIDGVYQPCPFQGPRTWNNQWLCSSECVVLRGDLNFDDQNEWTTPPSWVPCSQP